MESGRYQIYLQNLNEEKWGGISCEDAERLINAREALASMLDMETLFSMILSSHITFKSAVMEFGHQVFGANTMSEEYPVISLHGRIKVNECLMNTLNIGKLYLDKSFKANSKDDSVSFVGKHGDEALHKLFSEFRDDLFQINNVQESGIKGHKEHIMLNRKVKTALYLLGSKARNAMQHHSLLFEDIANRVSTPVDENGNFDYKNKASSKLNAQVPQRVIDCLNRETKEALRLEYPDGRVEISRMMDCYVDGISITHQKIRELMTPFIDRALELISNTNERYKKEFNLMVGECSLVDQKNGKIMDLIVPWDSARVYLESKHFHRTGFDSIKFE